MRIKHINNQTMIALLLVFSSWPIVYAQQQKYPTGDVDLTPEQLSKIVLEREPAYVNQYDGAAPLPSIDLSKLGPLELMIKRQGAQFSCASVAASYSVDILERLRISASPFYLWDLFLYEESAGIRRPDYHSGCRPGSGLCNVCGVGLPLSEVVEKTTFGLPTADAYRLNNCGVLRPFWSPGAQQKYRMGTIYLGLGYVANDNPTPDTQSVDIAMQMAKAKLSNRMPVMISIASTPFLSAYESSPSNHSFDLSDESAPVLTGWHAMTVVGFDESRQAFKIANSWARSDDSTRLWGADGYLWITYRAFKKLVRYIAYLSPAPPPDSSEGQPSNTINGLKYYGRDPKVFERENLPLGTFAISSLVKAGKDENIEVCLDANDWYPDRSLQQVLIYHCNNRQNQKWQIVFRQTGSDGDNLFIIRSMSPKFPKTILTVRDELKLEIESAEPDEAQLWKLRISPSGNYVISWASGGGNYVLQVDPETLKSYTPATATGPKASLETFNRLDRQSWKFLK